jgi:2-polyprenyl-3-methyl-5-hydroxy-6-metoxy-1,4-benzoquinol methylase
LCGSNNYSEIFSGKDWKALKCNKCQLVKIERKKNEVSYDFYHRDDDYKKLESHFKNIFQKRVDLIKSFKQTPGTVLEIGCSNGAMLDIFKSNGWETWGVEPSENAEYAIDKGHKILQSTFEKVNVNPDYFDVVVMNHTLEHLEDPLQVIKKVYTLLKKDGIVLIDVPNFGSLSARTLGKNWKHLLPKEHNFQFTRETLSRLFEKAGLKVSHYESRSGIFEFANPFEELSESFFGFKKRFVTTLINLPYSLVSTMLNQGDSMSIVGQKTKA